MLTTDAMSGMPAAPWMPRSKRPEIENWLLHTQTDSDKNRMNVIGNIVVPHMSFFAANMLARMA